MGALAILCSTVVLPGLGTWLQVRSYCHTGPEPQFRFGFGFAALHDRLGTTMGEPVECEHTDPATGDLLQWTTTGLAYQRKGTNTPAFTDGRQRWILTPRGVAHEMDDATRPAGDHRSSPIEP
jgi:hypothetical protein